jgi:uncharacterized protein (DUF2384 family)
MARSCRRQTSTQTDFNLQLHFERGEHISICVIRRRQEAPMHKADTEDFVVRILTIAAEMTGAQERATAWFKHHPIAGWSGRTPEDLVREGKGEKVLAYLEAVRSGVCA